MERRIAARTIEAAETAEAAVESAADARDGRDGARREPGERVELPRAMRRK